MGDLEITYSIDRRGNPALLSKKESIAQQFINGVFMKPGNLPNLPIGLNVEEYLFSRASGIQSADVFATLKKACGEDFMRDHVGSLECYIVDVEGDPSFVLTARLLVDKDEADTMALVLTKQDDIVKFNYKFLSEGVKKAYDMS